MEGGKTDKGLVMKKFREQQGLYLECLGHLMGLQFQSKANPKPLPPNKTQTASSVEGSSSASSSSNPPPQQRPHKEEKENKGYRGSKETVINNLSLSSAKAWRPGQVTATLQRLGVHLKEEGTHSTEFLDDFVVKRPPEIMAIDNKKKVQGSKKNDQETSDEGNRIKKIRRGLQQQQSTRNYNPYYHSESSVNKQFICPIKRPVVSGSDHQDIARNADADDRFGKRPKLDPIPANSLRPKLGAGVGGLFSSVQRKVGSFDQREVNKNEVDVAPCKVTNGAILNTPNLNKDNDEVVPETKAAPAFKSAYSKLLEEDKKKGINRNLPPPEPKCSGLFKKSTKNPVSSNSPVKDENPELTELMAHEKMKGFEQKIVEAILSEVMEQQQITGWDDIAGLGGPKAVIKEIIIWPMLRPDIFKGLRASPKGILLFGPPGTGKTMIGRLIATQSNSTFFNISASSLTSKWIGDGEKMVRCLFTVARIRQPSVIFIDEIDSILTQRSDTEHESSRRLKTEFLIQFDGCGTREEDRVLVIGVTNRPQELDEAARRRLGKRIYIPLPDFQGRKQIVMNLMQGQQCDLKEEDIQEVAKITEGYSGADMRSLCQEASYGPIRDIGHMLENIVVDNVRKIQLKDFTFALKRVKSSVAQKDLEVYEEWDKNFGCHISDD